MNQFPRDQYDDGSGLDSGWAGQQQQWQQPASWDQQQQQFGFNQEQQIIPATQEIPINDNNTTNTGTTGETTITAAASRRQQQRLPPFSFITNPTINQILMQINPDLFISKLFYFFFYSAFGSLFPLMAVYFKQLGMNPIQAGILVGIRPFVEFIAAPFWSSIADRFHKSKAILLFSLCCWILFTFAMAFIRPPASACVIFNETHHILYTPYSNNDMIGEQDEFVTNLPENINANNANNNGGNQEDETSTLWPTSNENSAVTIGNNNLIPNASILSTSVNEFDQLLFNDNYLDQIDNNRFKRDTMWSNAKHKLPPNHVVGKSPLTVEYTLNYNQEKHISYLSPPFSTVVYKLEDVKEVFFLLFLLVVLGEFFSAPAITLADRATLDYLGEDTDKYGQQRMYGSFGWGITMLLVGMALDNSTKFKDHPCGPHSGERNYVTCFSIFAFLMSCAFLIATKFNFEETPEYSNEIQLNSYDDSLEHQQQQQQTIGSSTTGSGPKPWQNTAPAINIPKEFQEKKINKKTGEFIDRWKSSVFAQRTRTLPSWVGVLKSMNNLRKISFLLITWFMGFGVGLVFTFLFWHLQDLGGTPTLYGYASVINHISEIGAYFFSINLIQRFGPIKVLCIGLLCNACRFIYISWLDNPWWVLPFELIQGITHATVWAAACSYVMQNTDVELRTSAQGVMQGIYQGLGRGSGSILGGMLINRFGSRITFFLYGLLCAIVLALFVHLNYYRKNEGYKFEEEIHEDPIIINDSSALAPHGVPTNPIARSHSRQNMSSNANNNNEQQQQQQSQLKIGITLNPNDPNNNIQPNDWNPNTLWS